VTRPYYERTWAGYRLAYRDLFRRAVAVPPIDWLFGSCLMPGSSAWRAVRSLDGR